MFDICLCGIARNDCDYHKPLTIIMSEVVPVHDVSGVCFVPNVTQFSVHNLCDALDLVWRTDRWEDFTMITHTALFNRLFKNGLLDYDSASDTYSLQGMRVKNDSKGKTGGIFDSIVVHSDGRQVVLRTREH